MKRHGWLKGLVALILIAGVAALLADWHQNPTFYKTPQFSWLGVAANLSIIATLAALPLYAYYTYLLARDANGTLADVRQRLDNQAGNKEALYLNIDFWYHLPGAHTTEVVKNPRQPYYFDVVRNLLVLDF